ncbi:Disease resistance protein (CC-NBS-LRR class) family [Rhynchospora pubera]|uniref:Disease resistance protein (CC-NBS-LRR class) family n=1 Tax=Rhynchospora pubera TaxID=906938 RepID=A0AAV8ESN8_9POAL|nr:Disease resistance protein (CC-NBS-LRR class) family [Rhynchospora pubera]
MTGIELLVGGWFVSPVIKSVVQKAQEYLSANYELQKDTQVMVENLTRTLVLCQATVEEAEKRLINKSNLTTWLKMLKEAVYDADDVLDDIEAKSIKDKIKGKQKVRKFASSSFSSLKNVFIPDDNHQRLKKVLDKLTEISAQIPNFLHLVNMNENYGSSNNELRDQRETISLPSEEDVGLCGRQEELNLILEMILNLELASKKKGQNYPGLFVLPIVGMGGVGKTALAQAIYNNPEVQRTFETKAEPLLEKTFASKAWISVSDHFNVVLLMLKLIQSLGGNLRLDVLALEDVSRNLSSIISGVRFLVVLDDLFEKIECQWDAIHTTLSHGAPGSVVLITTQNQAFANRVATFGHITLNPLKPEIFWKLFKHFAFGDVVIAKDKKNSLKLIGKQIACKLHGLPLAAKIIGKLLRRNIDEHEWRRISRSEWWEIPEGKSQILPSIGVGYQHLDLCLRQCFAFCSVFPRNSLIEKDRLVQMWIAQNFIPFDINGARPEDVGRQWFHQLVELSFFQAAGDYKGYVIPNLMHDLAVIVSSDECFYLTDQSQKIPQSVRHLAVDTKNIEVVKGIHKHKNIRSFFYFGLCHVDET